MLKKVLDFENQVVALALSRRVWALISGPVTVYFLATYLRLDEQGYFYTFESIIALKVFFELGLSFVIMQFVSHETKNITVTKNNIIGDDRAISNISNILIFSKEKYRIVSFLLVTVIGFGGWVFFTYNGDVNQPNWKLAWFITVIFTSINLYFIPYLAILEGIGKRRSFYFKYLIEGVISSLLMWTLCVFGFGLLAVAATPVATMAISILWVKFVEKDIFNILEGKAKSAFNSDLNKELWSMQKKIAISWISGFFMTKLFSPMLFKFEGAETAGVYGLSMVVISNLYIVGVTFVNTKSPLFGSLISKNDYITLKEKFRKSISMAISIYVFGAIVLFICLRVLDTYFYEYRTRFLSDLDFVILLFAIFSNVIIASLQTFLRAFKDDPLVKLNLVNGLLNAAGGFIAIYFSGLSGLISWYCLVQTSICITVMIYTLKFFKTKTVQETKYS
ncbi:hypothetical protein LZT07_20270 [Vibrio fluvialis]|uniref:hypothetical protein n=1 Tax=Vibrio fluvialis TaxID=676 RepID=UPI001F3F1419|nr:hypothetical protein [Vibrio fluvialis]MCE7639649.1 hypothetical protein [Vibrio fluvialis]UPO64706.1 hypothetical protein [Vibrio fluvialis]